MSNSNFDIVKIDIERNNGSGAVQNLLYPSKDGFLWYTTFNGIVKYYGTTSVVYPFDDLGTEGVSIFYDIYEDSAGNVWVATNEGLYFFDIALKKGRWLKWQHPILGYDIAITDVIETTSGSIMVSTTSDYILEYIAAEDRFRSFRIPKNIKNTSSITDTQDDRIRLDMALEDGTIILSRFNTLYRFKDLKIEVLKDYGTLIPKKEQAENFKLVANGEVFAASSSGTYNYGNKRYRFDYIASLDKHLIQLPSKDFDFLLEYKIKEQSTYLTGIEKNNLKRLQFYILNPSNLTLLQRPSYIDFDEVIIDKIVLNSTRAYVSTGGSIYAIRLKSTPFESYLTRAQMGSTSVSVSTRGFAQDSKGDVFVTSYSGLFKEDKAAYEFKKVSTESVASGVEMFPNARELFFDKNDTLYYATESSSLYQIDAEMETAINYSLSTVRNDKNIIIISVVPWTDDLLLIGTNRGLYSFNLRTKKFKDESILNDRNNLSNTPIRNFFVESENIVWIATDKAGVFIKNFKTNEVDQITKENTDGKLGSNTVYAVHISDRGKVFFGTFGGLSILDRKTNEMTLNTKRKEGIANNVVVAFLENEQGLWFSSYNGLTCYHYDDDWFYNFFIKDGLPDNEFNQQSAFKSREGWFYFGGLNGFIRFDPSKIIFSKPQSTLSVISTEYYDPDSKKVIVYKQGALTTGTTDIEEIKLPYERNFLNLTYSISDPFNIATSTYEYQLDEDNNEWVDLGTSTNLRLNAISPGEHILKIRGTDASGNPTLNTLKIPIKVSQIFYKRTWFILLGTLILAILVIGFYQFRRYRWKEKLSNQRQVDQLESKALRAQMNPHFMFNALNGLQSTMILKGEREANKYLGSFSKLLRASLDMSKSDIITLEEEISYLEAYLSLEKQRQARELEVEIILDPDDIDIKKIKLPCMLFQPLLENAILHGLSPKREGQARLTIKFTEDGTDLIGVVTDNGIGRRAANELKIKNKKIHKSWATTIMEERIEIINKYTDHNVYFNIEDLYEDGQASGTKVTLKLPLVIASQSGML